MESIETGRISFAAKIDLRRMHGVCEKVRSFHGIRSVNVGISSWEDHSFKRADTEDQFIGSRNIDSLLIARARVKSNPCWISPKTGALCSRAITRKSCLTSFGISKRTLDGQVDAIRSRAWLMTPIISSDSRGSGNAKIFFPASGLSVKVPRDPNFLSIGLLEHHHSKRVEWCKASVQPSTWSLNSSTRIGRRAEQIGGEVLFGSVRSFEIAVGKPY